MNSVTIAFLYLFIILLIVILFYFSHRRVFNKEGYDKHGYNVYGFNKEGRHQNGTEIDDKKYNFRGFHVISRKHRNGTLYDQQGFDFNGYNQKGNNQQGFNRQGFHFQTHRHINGTYYNEGGFDYLGFDKRGYNNKGVDKDGFNVKGIDAEGFNRAGFNASGYDREGFNQQGFNKNGYNRRGFNASGFNAQGFDFQGFNIEGFDKNGFNKTGFDRHGYNRLGVDRFGFDKKGNSEKGPWWSFELANKELEIHIEKFKDLKPPYKILATIHPVFLNNGFNILGLPTHSSERDINRRGLELSKLAAINKVMAYSSDLYAPHIQRSEASIKGVASALQQPIHHLLESFFWFFTGDSIHEKIFQIFKEENYLYAVFQWNRLYQLNKNPVSLLNLALAESILFEITGEGIFLTNALKDWSKLLKSNSAMSEIINIFQQHAIALDLTQGDSIQTRILARMAERFFQLSQIFNDESINQKVAKVLNFYSPLVVQKTITPVLQELKHVTEELDDHEMFKFTGESSHAKISNLSEGKVNALLKKIEKHHETLKLYHYEVQSEAKTIFENLAQKMRNLAIFVANKTGDEESNELAQTLLKKAQIYCQSDMLKKKIQNDIQDILEAEQTHRLTQKIIRDLNRGSFSSARETLTELESSSSNSKVQEIIRLFTGLIDKKEAEYRLERAIERLKNASNTGYGFYEARSEVKMAIIELAAMETDINNKIKLLGLLRQLE